MGKENEAEMDVRAEGRSALSPSVGAGRIQLALTQYREVRSPLAAALGRSRVPWRCFEVCGRLRSGQPVGVVEVAEGGGEEAEEEGDEGGGVEVGEDEAVDGRDVTGTGAAEVGVAEADEDGLAGGIGAAIEVTDGTITSVGDTASSRSAERLLILMTQTFSSALHGV